MKIRKNRKTEYGFTMMETLLVVAIIVLLLAVSALGFSAMKKDLEFSSNENYAEILYSLVQNRVMEMYNNGTIDVLKANSTKMDAVPEDSAFRSLYRTSASAILFPGETSLEKIGDGKWVAEFDPSSGFVFAVFYSEKATDYNFANDSNRTEENRKTVNPAVGYYGISSELVPNSSKPQYTLTLNALSAGYTKAISDANSFYMAPTRSDGYELCGWVDSTSANSMEDVKVQTSAGITGLVNYLEQKNANATLYALWVKDGETCYRLLNDGEGLSSEDRFLICSGTSSSSGTFYAFGVKTKNGNDSGNANENAYKIDIGTTPVTVSGNAISVSDSSGLVEWSLSNGDLKCGKSYVTLQIPFSWNITNKSSKDTYPWNYNKEGRYLYVSGLSTLGFHRYLVFNNKSFEAAYSQAKIYIFKLVTNDVQYAVN